MPRKSRFAAALLCAILAAAAPLAAQEPVGKVGIGLTFNPANVIVVNSNSLTLLPAGFNNFLLPIEASARLSIEPELGLYRTSASSNSGGTSTEQTFTNYRVGIGLLMTGLERGGLRPYFGPRIGIIKSISNSKYAFSGNSNEQGSSQTNWYVSGVVGAQYFFTRHFSLGGEVQLTYLREGTVNTTPPPSTSPDQSSYMVGTAGLIMVRCFF